MTIDIILFVVFAGISAASAVLMITRKNPVVSALFLITNFGGLSGLYLLLRAQFIAVVQVIVYAGAIMVLFLFVIMLLRPVDEPSFFSTKPKLKFIALLLGGVILFQTAYLLLMGNTPEGTTAGLEGSIPMGTIEGIGTHLYTTYLLPFESIAFLLLAATVGALVIAKKKFE